MTEPTDNAVPAHVPGQLTFTPDSDPVAVLFTRALNGDQEALEQIAGMSDRLDMAVLEHRTSALEHVARCYAADTAAGKQLDDAIAEARGLGATWQQIGDAVGMTRQSAWKRWHRPDETEAPA